jgi:hypothetical protein
MSHGGLEKRLFVLILIAIVVMVSYNFYQIKIAYFDGENSTPVANSGALVNSASNVAATNNVATVSGAASAIQIEINETELSCGWYYGFEDQKKEGTPDNWVWFDAGRSSIWKAPGNVDLMCK